MQARLVAAAAAVAAPSLSALSEPSARASPAQDAVAVGEHTLKLDREGRVWSVGACGLGFDRTCENADVLRAVLRRRAAPLRGEGEGEGEAKIVAGGFYHNLVLDAAGRVHSWGCGVFTSGGFDGVIPALGHPTARETTRPTPIAGLGCGGGGAATTAPVRQLAAGTYHSAVLLEDGRVLTFGANQLGQLGRPVAATAPTDSAGLPVDPAPAAARGLPPAAERDPPVHLGAGFYNTLVACRSGRLYCSGENQHGQVSSVCGGMCAVDKMNEQMMRAVDRGANRKLLCSLVCLTELVVVVGMELYDRTSAAAAAVAPTATTCAS